MCVFLHIRCWHLLFWPPPPQFPTTTYLIALTTTTTSTAAIKLSSWPQNKMSPPEGRHPPSLPLIEPPLASGGCRCAVEGGGFGRRRTVAAMCVPRSSQPIRDNKIHGNKDGKNTVVEMYSGERPKREGGYGLKRRAVGRPCPICMSLKKNLHSQMCVWML